MVPFVPCQPLAIALGAKLGFAWAFPITAAGQCTAGTQAFVSARHVATSQQDKIQEILASLNDQALETFQSIQTMTSVRETDTSESYQDERTILLALIGLRVAPFFPFSAGNYLLGGATAVPLRLFVLATVFGCLASNGLSTSIGAGSALLLFGNGCGGS